MVKKMRKSRFWAFLGRKQYVIAGAIVIAAAVATTVIYIHLFHLLRPYSFASPDFPGYAF